MIYTKKILSLAVILSAQVSNVQASFNSQDISEENQFNNTSASSKVSVQENSFSSSMELDSGFEGVNSSPYLESNVTKGKILLSKAFQKQVEEGSRQLPDSIKYEPVDLPTPTNSFKKEKPFDETNNNSEKIKDPFVVKLRLGGKI